MVLQQSVTLRGIIMPPVTLQRFTMSRTLVPLFRPVSSENHFKVATMPLFFFVFFGISVNSTALSNCRIFSLFAPVSKLLTFSYFNVMLFAFASAFPCLKFFDMPQHFTLSKQSYSGSVSIQLLLPLDLRFQICTMKCNYGKCYTFL